AQIYPLSLHDALPISVGAAEVAPVGDRDAQVAERPLQPVCEDEGDLRHALQPTARGGFRHVRSCHASARTGASSVGVPSPVGHATQPPMPTGNNPKTTSQLTHGRRLARITKMAA